MDIISTAKIKKVVEDLKSVVLGQIPNYSLTDDKLVNDGIKAKVAENSASLDKKAQQNDMTTIQSQFNNLVANAGDTDNNAELLDMRIGADGTARSTSGVSVRKQFENLFEFPTNYYTDGNKSVTASSGTWKQTSVVINTLTIGKTYKFSIDEVLNAINEDCVAEAGCYDSGDVRILKADVLTIGQLRTTFTVPENTTYIKLIFFLNTTTAVAQETTAYFNGISLIEDSVYPKLKKDISKNVIDVVVNEERTAIFERNEITRTATTEGTYQYTKHTITNFVIGEKYALHIDNFTGNIDSTIVMIRQLDTDSIITTEDKILYDNDNELSFTIADNTSSVELYFYLSYATTSTIGNTVTFSGVSINTVEKLRKDIIVTKDNIESLDYFELNVPSDIYIAVGYPLEIYNKQVCCCGNIENYHFEWLLASGGKSMGRKIVITPTTAQSGTTATLTLNVYDNTYSLVDSATSTIHYIEPSSSLNPVSIKKILCIGDSLTDIDVWRNELLTNLNNEVGSNFEFVGTLGSNPLLNEGHSGWSIASYLTDTSEGYNGDYKVKVSVTPTITSKKQYYFGTKIFEYEKTEIENEEIWVYFNRVSGSGYVSVSDSPATEVDNAVAGDPSISFTDVQITSLNPFYNTATFEFDANYYSTNYLSGVAPDYVFLWVGANGVSPIMDINTVEESVETQIGQLKTIIDNIQSSWGSTKIFLCHNHFWALQSGLGHASGTTYLKESIDLWVFNFNKKLDKVFKDYTNLIIVPIGECHDSDYNFPSSSVNINTRNATQETIYTDRVHPSKTTGFLQFADVIYGAFTNNL